MLDIFQLEFLSNLFKERDSLFWIIFFGCGLSGQINVWLLKEKLGVRSFVENMKNDFVSDLLYRLVKCEVCVTFWFSSFLLFANGYNPLYSFFIIIIPYFVEWVKLKLSK